MNETWKPVVGFEGYEVSDLGRVRSYRPQNGRGPLKKEPRLLIQNKMHGKKYFRVGMSLNGKLHCRKIHHLVLEAFVGPRPAGAQGCHEDDNQSNNALSNLYWGTHKQNVENKIANGKQFRGSQISLAVIDEVTAARIKRKLANDNARGSVARIAREENISRDIVSCIKHGKTWKHV